VSFFKSQQAFSTASTIIGTLIGFLTGIYLPIGNLPSSVQTIIKAFPVSHAAALFRQVIMEEPLKFSFGGVDPRFVTGFKEYMGVIYNFGGSEVSPLISVLILAGTAVVFFALSVWNLSRNVSRATERKGLQAKNAPPEQYAK
jgi:multidrug/hemolysin transport system permease protein